MVVTKTNGSNGEILSMNQMRNGFHGKYLAICKTKNLMPLPEVKVKQHNVHVLDFHADRVRAYDWLAIYKALFYDKTLKFMAIRLRKNNEKVLEEINSMKKTKTLVTHPVIYSKFVFTELVQSLQNLMTHNTILETLIIEGLPLRGQYMATFAKGLSQNRSIKTLSFSRSIIGDDGCGEVCSIVKHLMNIETINFSGCNLSIKGAEAVKDLIKFQKIQRFSEAWACSLRYQNIDTESFSGLRKIMLNNNPEIQDEGLALLTEALCEDVWIKDIEMQNCGLGEEGAQCIIRCLSINKTVLNFNIAGNPDVPEHLHRHIIVHLGSADQDSSDSCDSKSTLQKITKSQLSAKIKFLEEQMSAEIFRRKQTEHLNEQLHDQMIECQKRINLQETFKIPDGFTLIANETLDKLLKGKSIKNRRKHRTTVAKKARSCVLSTPNAIEDQNVSKSECALQSNVGKEVFVERNIGDYFKTQGNPIHSAEIKYEEQKLPMAAADVLQLFARKKRSNCGGEIEVPVNFDPRSLFTGTSNLVPTNSGTHLAGS